MMSRKIFENKKDRERAMMVLMCALDDTDLYVDPEYKRGMRAALNRILERFEINIIHQREKEKLTQNQKV